MWSRRSGSDGFQPYRRILRCVNPALSSTSVIGTSCGPGRFPLGVQQAPIHRDPLLRTREKPYAIAPTLVNQSRRMCESAGRVRQAEYPSHIVLAVGEVRTLALRSLGMAGYRWSGSVSGPEPGAVTLELGRGELHPGGKPGLSAPEEAVLRGIRPGRALVRLQQRRPWEQDTPAALQLELEIEVRP